MNSSACWKEREWERVISKYLVVDASSAGRSLGEKEGRRDSAKVVTQSWSSCSVPCPVLSLSLLTLLNKTPGCEAAVDVCNFQSN